MICRNCGKENEAGHKFCNVCGAPLTDVPVDPLGMDPGNDSYPTAPAAPVQQPAPEQPAAQPYTGYAAAPAAMPVTPVKKKPAVKMSGKLIASILGALSGLISIIMSFAVRDMSAGGYVSSVTYGGDAYTGIQNAAASTANYVGSLSRLVRAGVSDILLVFGLAVLAYFLVKVFESLEKA